MKIKTATGLISWFLKKTNFQGITMPWKAVYIVENARNYNLLIAHESTHIDQINKYGPFRWSILYLFYMIRYGYYDNPFEIEARNKAGY